VIHIIVSPVISFVSQQKAKRVPTSVNDQKQVVTKKITTTSEKRPAKPFLSAASSLLTSRESDNGFLKKSLVDKPKNPPQIEVGSIVRVI